MVGTNIELSTILIKTSASMGLHVAHPLWVTWDAAMDAATPDPVDSFSNLDETVFAASSAAMGPGTLLLPNFAPVSCSTWSSPPSLPRRPAPPTAAR